MQRIVIIGNGGSGKTWLSQRLSEKLKYKVCHLDRLFWEPGGFNKKRPKDVVYREIEEMSQGPEWICEGVFGELAQLALPRATKLIFLDKSSEECVEGLLCRGALGNLEDPEMTVGLDVQRREELERSFQALVQWAREYYIRTDLRSQVGHQAMFDGFDGEKIKLMDRASSGVFLNSL
jgi:adenylate kinase family enzyme